MVLLSQNEQLFLLTALLIVLIFFALAFGGGGGGGRRFENFVYFCTTRGKKQLLTERLLKLLRVIRIYTKFSNFAGLDFPHFTTVRDQTL